MLWCQKSIQRPACRLQTGRTGMGEEVYLSFISSVPLQNGSQGVFSGDKGAGV